MTDVMPAQRGSAAVPAVRLHLHTGMNKTGTSAIQRFLSKNDHQLMHAGWPYPRAGRSMDAHYELSRALGFDTRIVIYLRRHDHWCTSVCNQAVKMVADPPWERGIQGYIRFTRRRKGRQGGYRELLDARAAVFGAERLHVRPYESQQNSGGVIADLLRTIGAPELADAAPTDVARVNASLSAETLQLREVVQRASISEATRRPLKERLLALPADGSAATLLRPRLRRRLVEEQQADYDHIARIYLGREPVN